METLFLIPIDIHCHAVLSLGVMTTRKIFDEEAARSALDELNERRKQLRLRREQIYKEIKQRRADAEKELEKEVEQLRRPVENDFEQWRADLNRVLDDIKAQGRNCSLNMNEAASIMGVTRQRLNKLRQGQED